ncbi:transcriptional regulatory protein DevR [Clostridium aceticum]|uniref:Stage 0 sporulation protein A homolog n=1 Tax=Clostridium aceticum TaxID=84022 RepID=A0A0D8I7D9_9CLOT|nr:response regulator transcription factor [Clostridium aceticum]AKL94321.1 transcriptional regulatory protein DevR [Clostridium aceticum]KJF26163.1 hypothetical protein TZ02_15070 [Clostridium aceticum]
MKKKISILLVDDHSIVRWGIRSLIEENQRLVVCGEAETLTEAIELVEELLPDVVLLDVRLPDGDGVIGCKRIKTLAPKSKVLMLTAYAEDQIVIEAIKAGADGYILKNIESKKIMQAIFDVYEGTGFLDPCLTESVLNQIKSSKGKSNLQLTLREEEILDLLCVGKSNKEIASALEISEKTVRNYVSKIMDKINVTNRTEAALFWSRLKSRGG